MSFGRTIWGPDSKGNVLVIQDGSVVSFGPGSDESGLDCADGEIVPGSVNAHTHIYSGLAPFGIPEPTPEPQTFVQILERLWWVLDRALDEESLRASARYYVAEALLAGTTTLIDHHESPSFLEGSLDVLADTCQELGMRALLCYGATERNGGRDEAKRGLGECWRFLQTNRRPLVRSVVGLHASFTVSDVTVRDAARLCVDTGAVMHVHMAEAASDVADGKARGYEGPLERLLELDALPEGSIMAHGVHLTEEQVRKAAERGIWLVQNPRSNRGNRVGYASALRVSDRVALGTDGYPARMDDEIAALREVATEHGDDPEAVERRISAGHRLASEQFGLRLAPLDAGAAADAVVRSNGAVLHVMVDGNPVVEDGRLLTADIDEIRTEAQRQATRLWAGMRELAQQPPD
jgi:cytosine/adenosine deaminase-related metal-dependent hydrolase